MSKKKILACIMYTNPYDDPGIIFEKQFKTRREAEAFQSGFNEAKRITEQGEDDPLEDYQTTKIEETL